MIFSGFFASTAKEQPMNFEQVMSYIWLGQALFALIPFHIGEQLAVDIVKLVVRELDDDVVDLIFLAAGPEPDMRTEFIGVSGVIAGM